MSCLRLAFLWLRTSLPYWQVAALCSSVFAEALPELQQLTWVSRACSPMHFSACWNESDLKVIASLLHVVSRQAGHIECGHTPRTIHLPSVWEGSAHAVPQHNLGEALLDWQFSVMETSRGIRPSLRSCVTAVRMTTTFMPHTTTVMNREYRGVNRHVRHLWSGRNYLPMYT
jgi:hypothetical protein